MLTTVQLLKERLGIERYEMKFDSLLAMCIATASARFEVECRRLFLRRVNHTQEFPGNSVELILNLYPVESITMFELKSIESDGWQSLDNIEFIIRNNCVVSLFEQPGEPHQQLKLTYTGGYVPQWDSPQDGQFILPQELVYACVEQSAYIFQNRDRLGLVSFAGLRSDYEQFFKITQEPLQTEQTSNVRVFLQFEQIDLLPVVKAILSKYKKNG